MVAPGTKPGVRGWTSTRVSCPQRPILPPGLAYPGEVRPQALRGQTTHPPVLTCPGHCLWSYLCLPALPLAGTQDTPHGHPGPIHSDSIPGKTRTCSVLRRIAAFVSGSAHAPSCDVQPEPPADPLPSLSRRPSVILPALPTQSVLNYLLHHFSRSLPRPYVKGASRGLSSEVRSHRRWAPVPTPAGQLGRSPSVLTPLGLPLPQGSQRTPASPTAFSTAHLKDPPKTDDNSLLNSPFFALPGDFRLCLTDTTGSAWRA